MNIGGMEVEIGAEKITLEAGSDTALYIMLIVGINWKALMHVIPVQFK